MSNSSSTKGAARRALTHPLGNAGPVVAAHINPPDGERHSDDYLIGFAAGANYTAKQNAGGESDVGIREIAGWKFAPVEPEQVESQRGGDVVASIIDHVKDYDTKDGDPRRRFTRAQLETAIRLALAAPATPAQAEAGGVREADAYLKALLDYSGGFYMAAIENGMRAAVAADAVQHIERAARNLHRLTSADI